MEQIIFARPRTRKSGLSPNVFLRYVLDDPFSSTGQENSFVHYVSSQRHLSAFGIPNPPQQKKLKFNNPPQGRIDKFFVKNTNT